jgi:hypothetical protein
VGIDVSWDTATPLCLQTPVDTENSVRMEAVEICSGCVTYGETAHVTVMTIATPLCSHIQVRSLPLAP